MSRNDWDLFRRDVSWFPAASVVRVGEPVPFASLGRVDAALAARFPKLAALLGRADLTRLETKRGALELLAWDHGAGRGGWLCEPPTAGAPPGAAAARAASSLHPDHLAVLGAFGGVTERFNEPDSWLLNLNSALVPRFCRVGLGDAYDYYRDACHDDGVAPVVRDEEYIAFAFEANGNTTLYHRETGEVILFAPDHSFDFVVQLEGCPRYTFYRLRGAPTLRDWVETVAGQWTERQ